MKRKYLTFGDKGNAKLKKLGVSYFSLPAGFTCPFAEKCLRKATIIYLDTGEKYTGDYTISNKEIKNLNLGVRVLSGDKTEYSCYASSAEVRPSVRISRWKNYSLLTSEGKNNSQYMFKLILESLNRSNSIMKGTALRIHDSGDFFNEAYFLAWLNVAKKRTDLFFYAYTKSLPYWKKYKNQIPVNLKLIASRGGSQDKLINEEGFREAIIAYTVKEAEERGLPVDFSEAEAIVGDSDFILLLHGSQKDDISAMSSDNTLYLNQLYAKYGDRIDKPFIQSLINNLLRPYEISKEVKWVGEVLNTDNTEEINEQTIIQNETLYLLETILGV